MKESGPVKPIGKITATEENPKTAVKTAPLSKLLKTE